MPEAHFEVPQHDQPEVVEEAREEVQAAEEQEATLETEGQGRESTAGKQVAQVYAQPPPPAVADDDQAVVQAQPAQPMSDDDIATQKLQAKDGDLIEKEWVERAKSIINKTGDDPHRQKYEVSKIKAAYIQKRFNKVIKTDEATA